MTSENESVRANAFLTVVVTLIAACVNGFLLLDVAELQSAAMIVVHREAPESTAMPSLDVGLIAIAVGGLAPLVVFGLGIARRWSLPYFLGWLLAVVLAVVLAGALAAFATYRYWRDHQAVAERWTSSLRET